MSTQVTITSKPFGPTYGRLVDYAASLGGTFTLVMRAGIRFKKSAEEFRALMRGDLVEEHRTTEWPGTRAYDPALPMRYNLSPHAVHALKAYGFALYDWQAPRLPEDLAFYLPTGACWLGSIAHEQDSFVFADVVDLRDVKKRVPGLNLG